MEREIISENQIKFVLDKSDLLSHDISVSDLTYGKKRMELLFQELTDQAMAECQFNEENMPLQVEAVPLSQDSIMIIATKATHKDQCMDLTKLERKTDQLSLREIIDTQCVNNSMMEKISESQFKIFLSKLDLLIHDICISDLEYDSKKTQRFYQKMMNKAITEYQFNLENTPIMIEAIPIQSDSIIILFTKVEEACDDHLARENAHVSRGNNAVMKKFSESQIRIYLSQSVLQNQDISMSDVSDGTIKMQLFFRKMIEKAITEYQFDIKKPVRIETVTVPPNSIVLIVKLLPERDDRFTNGNKLEQQEQYKYSNHSIMGKFIELLKRNWRSSR